MKKIIVVSLCLIMITSLCGFNSKADDAIEDKQPAPTVSTLLQPLMPVASGVRVSNNKEAEIDYSNVADGYIMARYLTSTDKVLCIQITSPVKNVYTYRLNDKGEFEVFPLSEGDGNYEINIYKQISGNTYSHIHSLSVEVKLADEYAPFLRPNQFVNYNTSSLFLDKAAQFKELGDNQVVADAIYEYIIKNMKYSDELAKSDDAWYKPDLDRAYTEMTGTCFDYSALMVAMLRSIGIPAKLVTGYGRKSFHAWVEVYLESSGWKRRDPMLASVGCVRRITSLLISNDANYTAMFWY